MFAMLIINLFLLALVATLSFDNLMPFIRLSTLKFLSRVYMVFSTIFIMASFGLIGIKFKEIQLYAEKQPEESFNDLESEEVQDLVKHSINMNMNTEKKISGFVERLRSQRNFELDENKGQEIAQFDEGEMDDQVFDNERESMRNQPFVEKLEEIGTVTYRNRVMEKYGVVEDQDNSAMREESRLTKHNRE